MRLLLIGDPHFTSKNPRARLDNLPEAQKAKIEEIIRIIEKHKVKAVLISGDIFDTPYQGYPTLIYYFFKLQEMNCRIFTVFGQHDLFFHSLESKESTALGALFNLGAINIAWEKPQLLMNKERIWIYGCSYGEEIPQKLNKPGKHILIIHKSIAPTPPWHGAKEDKDYYSPSRVYDKGMYDLVLCGDWHGQFYWRSKGDTHILNPGSLVRKTGGYEDYYRHPTVVIWDTKTNEIEEILLKSAKPSEEILTREHLESLLKKTKRLKEFSERLKAGGSSLGPSYLTNLLKAIERAKQKHIINESVIENIKEAIDHSAYKHLLGGENAFGFETTIDRDRRESIEVRISTSRRKSERRVLYEKTKGIWVEITTRG